MVLPPAGAIARGAGYMLCCPHTTDKGEIDQQPLSTDRLCFMLNTKRDCAVEGSSIFVGMAVCEYHVR